MSINYSTFLSTNEQKIYNFKLFRKKLLKLSKIQLK